MPLTVRDLIDDPDLGLEQVVECDLDRRVRWVHTTELADPSRYLQGDEVILTTGVWIAAGTRPVEFVRPLVRAGIAALGYGLPAPDAAVPPGLVAACRRHALTLFRVPFELPFIAISEAFVERLASDRQEALEASVRRNAAFVRAAEHGEGLDGLLRVLSRTHSLRSWVIGPSRRVLARCGCDPTADQVEAVATEAARLQADYPAFVPGWLIFPIVTVGPTELHLLGEVRSIIGGARLVFDSIRVTRLALSAENRQWARDFIAGPRPDTLGVADANDPRPTAGRR